MPVKIDYGRPCDLMNEKNVEYAQKLEKEKKWEDAAKQYIRVLDDDPSPAIFERIAWCLSRAGKYNDSIKYLQTLHELEPESAKWLYMIGYQYYCQKEWKRAIEWLEKALEKHPDYFVVKYRLAYAYIQDAGNFKKLTKAEYWKALGHLRECHRLWITFDENKKNKERHIYFEVNFLHGKILMDLPNHRKKAIKRFQAALEINPEDEFTLYNLAKTYYLDGDYEKAKEVLPDSNQYYVVELAAYIDAKLGEYEKAISAVTKLLSIRRRDYLYRFLAEVYLLCDNLEEAYKMAQKALSLGQNNHKNFFTLAKVYYQYGLLNKAIDYLDTATKIKQSKYELNYNECCDLREKILSIMPPNYHDDEILLSKLNKLNDSHFQQGVICRFNTQKGYGFIKTGHQDIFFHVSNCKYKGISVGDTVQFRSTMTEKGIMAIDLLKTK